jgi:hypothetical protein
MRILRLIPSSAPGVKKAMKACDIKVIWCRMNGQKLNIVIFRKDNEKALKFFREMGLVMAGTGEYVKGPVSGIDDKIQYPGLMLNPALI